MKLDENVSVVDVRTPEEFSIDHYPGAVNIPLEEILQRLNELKNMPKPLVVYCKSGGRSGVAVSLLKQNGIPDAINGGGLDDLLNTKSFIYV